VTELITLILGLLVAGYATGQVRSARPGVPAPTARPRRTQAIVVLVLLALPLASLMLAKLFHSDVLGWVFGLSLMAGLALLPCAAIFYIGLRFGTRRQRAPVSTPAATAELLVHVERGSVHASDDAPPRQVRVPPQTTLHELLAVVMADGYLPRISGGQATWVVASSSATAGDALQPIAVCAQQWDRVMFLLPADVAVATHFGTTRPQLTFTYRCQDDPDAVAARLKAAPR
jgi:hypothetical protein